MDDGDGAVAADGAVCAVAVDLDELVAAVCGERACALHALGEGLAALIVRDDAPGDVDGVHLVGRAEKALRDDADGDGCNADDVGELRADGVNDGVALRCAHGDAACIEFVDGVDVGLGARLFETARELYGVFLRLSLRLSGGGGQAQAAFLRLFRLVSVE